jgi:predicted PurR-regulated permease PerM
MDIYNMHRTQVTWLFIMAGLAALIYACWGMLTPFVISLAVSYILYPITAFLEKHLHMSRWIIALILVAFIVAVLLTIILVIAPLIYRQTISFVHLAPHYKGVIDNKIAQAITKYVPNIAPEYIEKIRIESFKLLTAGLDNTVQFLGTIWSSRFVLINLVWLVVLVPFITFYMLKDWDRILFYAINAVPKNYQKAVRKLFVDIDYTVARVIRGQFNVCLILSLYYTIALTMLRLNYSILLGILTGVLSFIPIVGPFTGFVISMIVGYLQFNTAASLGYISGIFAFGIMLDSTLISPNIIGKKIGLNPVWMIFAILLGGKLFGFAGILLAVPLAAVAGIIVKNALAFYYKSSLYDRRRIS